MHLHLFSLPGEPLLRDIIAAARQHLAGRAEPLVAYLPAAAVERHFVRETKAAFRGLARVETIKVESHPAEHLHAVLTRADVLYIPGGNTYLMAQRLHSRGLMSELRERLRQGLPLVAFSAGAVLCGPDIRTSNDENTCGCAVFDGLGVLPFGINVHFPVAAGAEQAARLSRLHLYAAEHACEVLALADSAYVQVSDGAVKLVRGEAWWITADSCTPV